MKLSELIERLQRLDQDAEVADRFGDEITHATTRLINARRYVFFATDALDYKQQINELEQRCDDAAISLERMGRVIDSVTKTLEDLKDVL